MMSDDPPEPSDLKSDLPGAKMHLLISLRDSKLPWQIQTLTQEQELPVLRRGK